MRYLRPNRSLGHFSEFFRFFVYFQFKNYFFQLTWGSTKHGVLALSHRNHQYFLSTLAFKRSFHSGNDKPKGIFENFKGLFKRFILNYFYLILI